MLSTLSRVLVITVFAALLVFQGCKKREAYVNNAVGKDSVFTTAMTDSAVSNAKGFQLTDYDTPPSPTLNPMPSYPAKFKSSGIQGVVVLDVQILKDGSVGDIKVIKSLLSEPGGLDDAAETAVRKWLFKPAMKDSKPVESRVNIPISFSLKSVK
jgi:protein TonB